MTKFSGLSKSNFAIAGAILLSALIPATLAFGYGGGSPITVTTTPNIDGTVTGTISTPTNATESTPAGDVDLSMPADLAVTGPAGWTGEVDPPTFTTTSVTPSVGSESVSNVDSVDVGFGDTLLTFDQGVRLDFAGRAGTSIGYDHGPGTFTEITNVCASDSQAVGDALPAGGDCAISVGSDLIVWTKHFSEFTSFVATPTATVSSSGGGGGGNGPISGSLGLQAVALPNNGQNTGSLGSTGQVLGASAYNFATNFGVGASGEDVTQLQTVLIADGYLDISAPTGYFGALTKAAVVKFQAAESISPTSGYVGPLTRAVLNQGVTPTTQQENASVLQSLESELQGLLKQIAALGGTTSTSTQ